MTTKKQNQTRKKPARSILQMTATQARAFLLKPESYKQMFAEVRLKDGKGSGYGLGVFVRSRDGHQVLSLIHI